MTYDECPYRSLCFPEIKIRVLDRDGVPIRDAKVSAVLSSSEVTTDVDGEGEPMLGEGDVRIKIAKSGYMDHYMTVLGRPIDLIVVLRSDK